LLKNAYGVKAALILTLVISVGSITAATPCGAVAVTAHGSISTATAPAPLGPIPLHGNVLFNENFDALSTGAFQNVYACDGCRSDAMTIQSKVSDSAPNALDISVAGGGAACMSEPPSWWPATYA
jgi:hypothetical protein